MRPQEQPGCHTKRTGQCRNPQRRKESIHTGLNKYGSEDSQQSPDGGPPIDLIKSHSQRYSSKHRTKAEQTVGDIPTVTLIQNGNGQCQGRSDSSPNGSPLVADRQYDQKLLSGHPGFDQKNLPASSEPIDHQVFKTGIECRRKITGQFGST